MSNFRSLHREPAMMTCALCKGDFHDNEKAYRVASGTVHFSVPSFTVETTSAYYHEKCWQKLKLPQHPADTDSEE